MQVLAYSYNGGMEQFRYPEDRYKGWAVLAVQSGHISFTIEGEESTSGEAEYGELLFCPPGMLLRRRMLQPSSFHFAELSGELELPPGKIRIRDVQRLSSTYDYLIRLRAEYPYELHPDIEHLIGDLLFLSKREYAMAQDQRRRTLDPVMHRAAALMERQACETDFSVQAIALRFGISAPQLSIRFQAAYGVSPIQFATSVRLAKAGKLLVETDDTLEAIADRCGYQNAFYFSRVFSKHMKISPSLYRRANRV
ncbi:AraC family transcriptional regulator [Paenibacillus methanolicus]|uniref:Helix-turn-helix protein n=1 Tax=Paenibacillus methanolicus TaxID=582686 RepID=A0A5S5CHW6_9BACL|nr:AraC family transcriptional regulator [Paenibacillus methanolicus]TYP79386.1 helix-turn-helix protein [Paenibacillus methanolicus]